MSKPHYIFRHALHVWVPVLRRSRSVDEFRQWLYDHGISLAQFCRDHNISEVAAKDLLRGKQKGTYGKSHLAAVAMGLKPDPEAGDKRSAA